MINRMNSTATAQGRLFRAANEGVHKGPAAAQSGIEVLDQVPPIAHFDRLRPHKGDNSDDDIYYASSMISESSVSESNVVSQSNRDGSASRSKRESSASDFTKEVADEANGTFAEISFGALANAQSNLDKDRPGSARPDAVGGGEQDAEALERMAGKKDKRDLGRTSKHAPNELSSKKAVSRKRSVVPLRKTNVRDPRFEPAVGKIDPDKVRKNYSFLTDYRDAEISELKAGIRKSKDANAKEIMKRALLSMESRKQTENLREQRQEVLRRHRKEEEAKIEGGKRPFYLKKSDVKKKASEERLQGMRAKDRAKAIERRRKKLTSRERKGMPDARRS